MRWLIEDVMCIPHRPIRTLHWAVYVPEGDEDDVTHEDQNYSDLDQAEDQLGAVLWNSNETVFQHLPSMLADDAAKKTSSTSDVTSALENLHVLELGAGVGCLGIACAFAGASRVVVTDIKELVPLMVRNVALNQGAFRSYIREKTEDPTNSTSLKDVCLATTWRWGGSKETPSDIAKHFDRRVDLVLLCDALYGNKKDWPLLIQTLNQIVDMSSAASSSSKKKNFERDGNVLVCNFCEQRVESVEDGFLELLRKTDPRWCVEGPTLLDSNSSLDMKVRGTKLWRCGSGGATVPSSRKDEKEIQTKKDESSVSKKRKLESEPIVQDGEEDEAPPKKKLRHQ